MQIPDPFARTVRLFVTVTNGQCKLLDGQPLPKLKADTHAELMLSPYDIEDMEARTRFTSERDVSFLPVGTTLWARVKPDDVSQQLGKHRKSLAIWPAGEEFGVAIVLQGDLRLLIRTGKNAILVNCACKIPALGFDADSVNEAYSKISTAFEPSRRSHAGNVFRCVFFQRADKFHLLNTLRLEKESEPK
jgi:hypothetical protein